MVVFSHHFAINGLPEPLVLKYQTLGGFGVLIFFALSGYLVSQSWISDPHIVRFIQRRLLRIWPGVVCTVLLCALFVGPMFTTLAVGDYFRDANTRAFLKQLFFVFHPHLPGLFATNPVAYAPNGVLWTIPLELGCYAVLCLFGILGVMKLKHGIFLLWLALVLWLFGGLNIESQINQGLPRAYFREYAAFFFAGVLMRQYRHHWLGLNRRYLLLVVASAMAALLVWLGHELAAALVLVPIFTMVIGESKTPILKGLGRYGDFSFGIYIYAFPIQQILYWLFPKMAFAQSLAISALLTLFLAAVSWHCIEKQALKLKPSRHAT
jgi:peptidoglycan/LPS O-acetylase OafA/YrhL